MKGFGIFLLCCFVLAVGFIVGRFMNRGFPADEVWLEPNTVYEVVSSTEVGEGSSKSYFLLLRTPNNSIRAYRLRENPPKFFRVTKEGDVVHCLPYDTNSPNSTPH